MSAWSLSLARFPFMNQHADADANEAMDCGPTSCAMVQCFEEKLAPTSPLAPTPTTVRQAILGANLGPTSEIQLAIYLADHDITTHISRPLSPYWTLWAKLLAGKPVIALIWNVTALHWIVVIGRTQNTVTYADPFTGMAVTVSRAKFNSIYRRILVAVK